MRVVLAAERPYAQNLLMDMVEKEPGAIVVGQAENAFRALGVVESSRPDVVIIDSNLPYSFGIDGVALSRMSGLDTAQLICQTMPNTHVIVINNLNIQVLPQPGIGQDDQIFFSRERIGGNTAFKLQEICRESPLPETPVFADVEVESWSASQQKGRSNEMFSGVMSVAGGLFLIGTAWLAPFGALLALFGVCRLCFVLFKRMTKRLRSKFG